MTAVAAAQLRALYEVVDDVGMILRGRPWALHQQRSPL
jgi:hypothetical protein